MNKQHHNFYKPIHCVTRGRDPRGRSARFHALVYAPLRSTDNGIRAHLHQRGAGPPAGAGSVFRAGRVFTLARNFTLLEPHFAAPDLWSINTDQSTLPIPAGPAEESLHERSLRAPAAEAERARGGVNSTT